MAQRTTEEAWEQIKSLSESDDPEALHQFLDELPPGELARAIQLMGDEMSTRVFEQLDPEKAADLIEILSDAQGAHVLEELPAATAAAVVERLESDDRADMLAGMQSAPAEAILDKLTPDTAEEARQLLRYDSRTAGGLMVTEYLAYSEERSIADVLNHLRANADRYKDYGVQYVYVIDTRGKLCGVIPLRDLVLRPADTPVTKVMIKNPIAVRAEETLEELEKIFDRHAYIGIPVVDEHYRLIGIVMREDVEEAHGDQADETFMRFSGIVGGEELRTMPLYLRALRRMSFLMPNILLNMVAASVIAAFMDVLDQVLLLAMFLPIISDMSGCSGNQAVAVSIRELSLGLIKPKDYLFVLLKEVQVGIINGIGVGILLSAVAFSYGFGSGSFPSNAGPFVFGAVVGVALAMNTLLSVSLGGLVPLGLKRMGIDPALASGPILTTVTDMCGFLFVFILASLVLVHLT